MGSGSGLISGSSTSSGTSRPAKSSGGEEPAESVGLLGIRPQDPPARHAGQLPAVNPAAADPTVDGDARLSLELNNSRPPILALWRAVKLCRTLAFVTHDCVQSRALTILKYPFPFEPKK